jgi:TniQ
MTVRPLPRSLDPLPGESLTGYVLRLAHRLDRPPSRITILTGLGRAVPGRSAPAVPASRMLHLDKATVATFAHATRLSAHEVAELCLDSLRDRYPPLDINHEMDGAYRQADGITGLARWVFTRSTRYCPQCLAGDGSQIQQAHGGAWQKRWHLPPVFACTVHRRLLLHQCPQCRRPVHSRPSGGLLPRLHDATLNPAQCRTTIGLGAHWRGQSACGARLDLPPPASSTASGYREDPTLERLLAVQHKLIGLLGSDGPIEIISAGRPATAAQYFLDLRLLVGLIGVSWPEARPLVEPWMRLDAIDSHLDQQRRQAVAERQKGRRTPDLVVHDRPPVEPAVCGSLLALADQILALDDPLAARERLDPSLHVCPSGARGCSTS